MDNSGNQDIAALLRRLSAANADERAEAAEGLCRAGEAASGAAVDLVRVAAEALGGKGGGGRPDMAQAGGPDPSRAADAIAAVEALVAGT